MLHVLKEHIGFGLLIGKTDRDILYGNSGGFIVCAAVPSRHQLIDHVLPRPQELFPEFSADLFMQAF